MNNEETNISNNIKSSHRILETDIKKDPAPQEDEIIFGCGCFGELRNVFGNCKGCYNFRRLCWW